nr:glycoside hydrolase family 2 protein [Cellulomonas sp. APG4]
MVAGSAPEEIAARLRDGIPARVPGVVHLDLQREGLIGDPFVDDAESELQWIGEADWEYITHFEWSPDASDRHDLTCDGLDTVATVQLNGSTVAHTVNQHRSYRFDVTNVLRPGSNELRVYFASPVRFAREQESVLGERPHSYHHPFNCIRKAAYSFGWDWGPDLASVGIWRSIGIHSWSQARIRSVRPIVDVIEGVPSVEVHVDLELSDEKQTDGALRLDVAVAGQQGHLDVTGPGAHVLRLEAPDAPLWWPRGHGRAALHELTVGVSKASGQGPLDSWSRCIGFRTIDIDLAPDAHGSAFTLRVNGEDVYVRGANWIPDDVFLPRIRRDDLHASITDATDAGINLLRVWGGGIYESEDFYELCDEAGVLVWQDFLLACAAYSEDAVLWDEFAAEAEEAVTRLTAHPSLAVWNGCNENLWGYVDWGWRPALAGRTWGEGYYRRLFPEIVARLAPRTPYIPGSPCSFSDYLHPNDDSNGIMHIWDVWNTHDYTRYAEYRPRFVSEFGFQGPPAWSTLQYAVHDEPADPFGPHLLVHQKATDGNGKLMRGLGDHLPTPATFEDWHWATQLNQARAVAFGIEHFRSLFPLNRGSVVWQLNDCWPSVSWAAVDSLRHRKPLWYALRRVYADRLVTVQTGEHGLEAIVHNDSPDRVMATGRLVRERFDGTALAEYEFTVDVAARDIVHLPIPTAIALPDDASREVLVVELEGLAPAYHWWAEDPKLALRGGDLDVSASAVAEGYEVRVQARTLTKDVTLLVDRVHPDASVDDALITLRAGASRVFRVQAPAGLPPEAFADRLVVRSANDLVATAAPCHDEGQSSPAVSAIPAAARP